MAMLPKSMNSDGGLSGDEGASPSNVNVINRYHRDTAKSKESVRIKSSDNFYRQTSSSSNHTGPAQPGNKSFLNNSHLPPSRGANKGEYVMRTTVKSNVSRGSNNSSGNGSFRITNNSGIRKRVAAGVSKGRRHK